jgi:hypothetical protein
VSKWHVAELSEADPDGLKLFTSLTFTEAFKRIATLRAEGSDGRIQCTGVATDEEVKSLKFLGVLTISIRDVGKPACQRIVDIPYGSGPKTLTGPCG